LIPTTLNWLKKKGSILALSLLGQYLRTHEEPDFQVRKATWTWLYNSLLNFSVMDKIFHLKLSHKWQIKNGRVGAKTSGKRRPST
jgi:hypothetical protein